MRNFFSWTVKIVFWILGGVAIYFIQKPFSDWYLSHQPAIGVDLYNSITYVSYHLKHFAFPWNGFKDIWFGGYPLMRDYPQLGFYFMLPAAYIWGAGQGVQITALFGLFLFLFFSYLLFSRVSKNFGVALVLTTLVFLSENIYGALTWAGSIPSFISQAFFPLILLVGFLYLKKGELRYVAGAALLTAIGILVHPLEMVTFVVPSLLILILFGNIINWKGIRRLVGHVCLYVFGFFFGSFIYTFDQLFSFFILGGLPLLFSTSTSGVTSEVTAGEIAIASFYKDQVASLFTHTHQWLLYALPFAAILFLFGLIIAKKRKAYLTVLPFIFIVLYTALHPILNFYGILNIFRHDPYRAFWPFPISLALLISSGTGLFFNGIKERMENTAWWVKINMPLVLSTCLSGILFLATFLVLIPQSRTLLTNHSEHIEYSSAFPESLSMSLKTEDISKLKNQLVPDFLDPTDKNKRLYASDATVNIWWNSLFDLPLMRGYIDPPVGLVLRGGLFWLDIAIANDSIVRDFDIPVEQAFQNSLFLLDWNAIHYFEGGHLSSKGSNTPPSSYLLERDVFEATEEVTTYGGIVKYETKSGKPEVRVDLPQHLTFYKVNEEHTSPILSATNAAPVLVISDFYGYEDILRLLGAKNINSQKIIPVYGDKYVDEFSAKEMSQFDAVILHQYTYKNKNKAYGALDTYIKEGGTVFIDTGSEGPDTDSRELPELFPFDSSKRGEMGKVWELTSENDFFTGEELETFAPLIFDNQPWKLTTPGSSALRVGSDVYLSHAGSPLLVSRKYGKGTVIWSGMNLPYHFNQYHADSEAVLFEKLLGSLVSLTETEKISAKIDWVRPEKVRITPSQKARGILFKEERYPGWKAFKGSSWFDSLLIYKTGPTYPGYMYVPLSEKASESIEFRYGTEPKFWLVIIVSFVVLVVLADLALGGKLVLPHMSKIKKHAHRHVGSWWEKEEE